MGTQPAKVYEGRCDERRRSWVTVCDNRTMAVRPLTHFKRHSPDGFAWGYQGSGPAELARCLLIDRLGIEGEDEANVDHVVPPWLYQLFKDRVVAGWPIDEPWRCTSDLIDGFLAGARG